MNDTVQQAQPWRMRALALLTASCFTAMAATIISPAVPAMNAHYSDTPHADLLARLALTLPSLFTGLFAPLAGWFADRMGRKRLLVGCAVLYALAGASGAVAPSLTTLLVGRVFLGIAVAGTMTAATTLIGDYFEGELRQKLYGYQVAFMTVGASLFILVGGGLAAWLGWRGPFLVYLVALAVVPLFVRQLYEPAAGTVSDRPPGRGLGTLRQNWGVAGLFALIGFWYIVLYLVPVQAPYLIAELGQAPAWPAALTMAILTSSAGLTSVGFSRIEARVGPRRLFFAGFAAAALGFAVVAQATTIWAIFAGVFLLGLSLGAIMPNAMAWCARLAPAALRGRVMGGATMAVFFGQFFSPFASQPLAAVWGLGPVFAAAAVACAGVAALFGAWSAVRRLPGFISGS